MKASPMMVRTVAITVRQKSDSVGEIHARHRSGELLLPVPMVFKHEQSFTALLCS
jgi:hypothetical protein